MKHIDSDLPDKSLEYHINSIKAQLSTNDVSMGYIRPVTNNKFYIMFKAGIYCTVLLYPYSEPNANKIIES